jgi:hypothetical protein
MHCAVMSLDPTVDRRKQTVGQVALSDLTLQTLMRERWIKKSGPWGDLTYK